MQPISPAKSRMSCHSATYHERLFSPVHIRKQKSGLLDSTVLDAALTENSDGEESFCKKTVRKNS